MRTCVKKKINNIVQYLTLILILSSCSRTQFIFDNDTPHFPYKYFKDFSEDNNPHYTPKTETRLLSISSEYRNTTDKVKLLPNKFIHEIKFLIHYIYDPDILLFYYHYLKNRDGRHNLYGIILEKMPDSYLQIMIAFSNDNDEINKLISNLDNQDLLKEYTKKYKSIDGFKRIQSSEFRRNYFLTCNDDTFKSKVLYSFFFNKAGDDSYEILTGTDKNSFLEFVYENTRSDTLKAESISNLCSGSGYNDYLNNVLYNETSDLVIESMLSRIYNEFYEMNIDRLTNNLFSSLQNKVFELASAKGNHSYKNYAIKLEKEIKKNAFDFENNYDKLKYEIINSNDFELKKSAQNRMLKIIKSRHYDKMEIYDLLKFSLKYVSDPNFFYSTQKYIDIFDQEFLFELYNCTNSYEIKNRIAYLIHNQYILQKIIESENDTFLKRALYSNLTNQYLISYLLLNTYKNPKNKNEDYLKQVLIWRSNDRIILSDIAECETNVETNFTAALRLKFLENNCNVDLFYDYFFSLWKNNKTSIKKIEFENLRMNQRCMYELYQVHTKQLDTDSLFFKPDFIVIPDLCEIYVDTKFNISDDDVEEIYDHWSYPESNDLIKIDVNNFRPELVMNSQATVIYFDELYKKSLESFISYCNLNNSIDEIYSAYSLQDESMYKSDVIYKCKQLKEKFWNFTYDHYTFSLQINKNEYSISIDKKGKVAKIGDYSSPSCKYFYENMNGKWNLMYVRYFGN